MKKEYTRILHERYVKQRERLLSASLETAGRYDRTHLTVSSGALALSVTFLDKIAPEPVQWTILVIVIAWVLLLLSIIFQLRALDRSENATKEQVAILDAEYKFYFSSDNPADKVREGFIKPDNCYIEITKQYNTIARRCLIVGIILIFVFSAINLWTKENSMPDQDDKRQQINESTGAEHTRGSYTPETSELPPPPPKSNNGSNNNDK
jgi:hypothetical protein